MFLPLNDEQIIGVSGGTWTEAETIHGSYDPVTEMLNGNFCGPTPDGNFCNPSQGYTTLDIGSGSEVRSYEDGHQELYKDGKYISDVELVDASATDGSPEIGIDVSADGAGFSYSDGDSITYNFKFVR